MERLCVTLDERTVRLLKAIGGGNVSQGIRAAADVAYEQWQKK